MLRKATYLLCHQPARKKLIIVIDGRSRSIAACKVIAMQPRSGCHRWARKSLINIGPVALKWRGSDDGSRSPGDVEEIASALECYECRHVAAAIRRASIVEADRSNAHAYIAWWWKPSRPCLKAKCVSIGDFNFRWYRLPMAYATIWSSLLTYAIMWSISDGTEIA